MMKQFNNHIAFAIKKKNSYLLW